MAKDISDLFLDGPETGGTVTNASNVPSTEARERCRHCGERIYRSGASGRWMHWANVERHCIRSTVAEPEPHECPSCGDPVEPGDGVTFTSDGSTRHVICADWPEEQ